MRRFFEAQARVGPICLVIEDLHWGDEALLTLLEHLAERALSAPLLIVTQARPELLDKRPTWGGGIRAFTSLLLEPIDSAAAAALADALCRERGLSATNAEHISRLAGGNPLFAEELCAAVAEGREAGGVPSTLRPLISARLDALPSDQKRALQHAAVLGKHVWPAGLAALDRAGDLVRSARRAGAARLAAIAAGSRFGGQREYVFKHDLIQEMAYGLLPRAERRRLHAQIVDWLEATAGERIEETLDLLAHHAVSAELDERALDYLARPPSARRGRRRIAKKRRCSSRRSRSRSDVDGSTWCRCCARGAGARCRESDCGASRAPTWSRHWRRCRWSNASGEPRCWSTWPKRATGPWTPRRCASTQRKRCTRRTGVGRADLALDARFWLAWATGSEGDVGSAIEQYLGAVDETNKHGVALAPSVLPLHSTALCWAGRYELAVERGRDAVRIAREAGDTDSTVFALQVLGLALAGGGAYDEATRVFDEAGPLWARLWRWTVFGPRASDFGRVSARCVRLSGH